MRRLTLSLLGEELFVRLSGGTKGGAWNGGPTDSLTMEVSEMDDDNMLIDWSMLQFQFQLVPRPTWLLFRIRLFQIGAEQCCFSLAQRIVFANEYCTSLIDRYHEANVAMELQRRESDLTD